MRKLDWCELRDALVLLQLSGTFNKMSGPSPFNPAIGTEEHETPSLGPFLSPYSPTTYQIREMHFQCAVSQFKYMWFVPHLYSF